MDWKRISVYGRFHYGTGYTEAIMDIDRLLGSRQMGDDLVVGFERKGRYNIATVRLSDFRVAATHVIKKPALKKQAGVTP